MNNGMGLCMAYERMLDVEIPKRVHYLRIITAELNRVASHLMAMGTFGSRDIAIRGFRVSTFDGMSEDCH